LNFIDKYRSRLIIAGGNARDEKIISTKQLINHVFRDDPNYYVVPISGVDIEARIYSKNTGNAPFDNSRNKFIQFLDPNYLPLLGSYVFWNNRYWMIIDVDDGDTIQNTGVIRECNYFLRWVNDRGDIIERWSIFHDRTRYIGTHGTQHMVTGSMVAHIWLPKDAETESIPRDFRFIVDNFEHAQAKTPATYRVTSANRVERTRFGGGLTDLTFTECTFNPQTDCRDELIADYFPRMRDYSLDLSTPHNIEVQLGGTFSIQILATVNGAATTKGLMFISENEDIAIVDQEGVVYGVTGGETTIKVSFHSKIIEIDVSVVLAKTQYQQSIHINGSNNLRLSGVSRSYSAIFYDNLGNEVQDIAAWSFEYNGTSGIPGFIEVVSHDRESNVITIRAIGGVNGIGQSFILRATNAAGTSSESMEINIVSF